MKTHKCQVRTLKFFNCFLIRDRKIIFDDLWVRDGRIINPEPIFYKEKLKEDIAIDCCYSLIAPGFIDLQINGGYGYDFSSDEEKVDEAISIVRKKILSAGVTSFCPTIVTSPASTYHKILAHFKHSLGGVHGAEVLGAHLEGPFISPEKKGAHPLQHIAKFNDGFSSLLSTYGDLSNVSIITVAPELQMVDEVIKELTQNRSIVVSLGHSTGNIEDGERSVNNGASFITHLFNAMLPFHHRDPGLVGLLTSQFINKPIFYGIIADGIHTHPAALRIAHRTHPEGLVLITDAMAALGLGDGKHVIGQEMVRVEGQRAFLLNQEETLAGSIAPMDECLRGFVKSVGGNIVDGVAAASLHPAQVLNLKNKGSLVFGSDADLVLLKVSRDMLGEDDASKLAVRLARKYEGDQFGDESSGGVVVLHTIIAGEVVYTKPGVGELVYKKRDA